MFVYTIINDINRKVYIGKTKKSNIASYFRTKVTDAKNPNYNTSSHLFASIRKYGWENFSIHPLVTDCANNEALCAWEQVLIELLETRDPEVGYNICKGGEGFTGKHSQVWKENQSKLLKALGHKPTLAATIKSIRVREESYHKTKVWPGAKVTDLAGVVLGGTTVIERCKGISKGGYARWLCRCSCGNNFSAWGVDLRSGHSRSCGCLKKFQNGMNLSRKGWRKVEGEWIRP